MQRYKLVGVMLGALFALAMMASSASAFTLPDISITLGGAYPLHAQGTLPSAATKLATASGGLLEGKGVTLLLETKELTSLGTFKSTFTNVVETAGAKPKCKTGTEPEGVVISEGTFHIVPLNTTGTAGILFLPTLFTITCGEGKTKIQGDLISSLNAGTESEELTKFGGVLEGKEGKQNITEFINDTGSKIKAKLECNTGAGFVSCDENVAGELPLEVLGSKMLVITGR